MNQKVVVVTGSSSGIGEALCREFHRRQCCVIATARRPESLAALAGEGMQTAQLDVNDAASVGRCMDAVVQRSGRIDIVVNNAGFGLMGPVLDIALPELRQQFETNVFAPLAIAKAAAAVMRRQGGGMLVNMGSISGVVTTPFSGAYCASKAALHALSDALRMELSPFGIHVVTVQPGSVRSDFGSVASRTARETLAGDSWYAAIRERIMERANMSQVGATPVEKFAASLVADLLRSRPPSRIRLGSKSFIGPLVKHLVPQRWLDRLLVRRFGLAALADGNPDQAGGTKKAGSTSRRR